MCVSHFSVSTRDEGGLSSPNGFKVNSGNNSGFCILYEPESTDSVRLSMVENVYDTS